MKPCSVDWIVKSDQSPGYTVDCVAGVFQKSTCINEWLGHQRNAKEGNYFLEAFLLGQFEGRENVFSEFWVVFAFKMPEECHYPSI